MADQALYRKYRSAEFSEVVGQDHIVSSLLGALEAGNISHAYLFTGPKGVGKTSVARLLARRLNSEAGEAATMDTIEIDAASNRSIDAIRDLRDKVGLAPSMGRYKVYIIDEVHMLTTEAFNALLKTLEEPPSHAIFILATTEAHKIPETIISRTQRYAFRPIERTNIIAQLTMIAEAEKFTTEPAALELIATAARGSFRDAISLLDQVGSSNQGVRLETVRATLGYSDDEALSALAGALLAGQTSEVLASLDRLRAKGVSAGQLITQLIEWWRELLSRSVAGQSEVSLAKISEVLEALIRAAKSPYPDLSLEVALVKLTLDDIEAPAPVPATAAVAMTPVSPQSPKPTAATETSAEPTVPAESINLADRWPKVLASIKRTNQNVFTVMQMSEASFQDDRVTLKVRVKFHRDQLIKQQHRQVIEQTMAKVYGRTMALDVQIDAGGAKKVSPRDQKDDLVSSALEILGGEVVD